MLKTGCYFDLDLKKALDIAKFAAFQASDLLLDGYQREIKINYKGATDLVTEYDLKSEKIISEIILNKFPDHQIVGEEEGARGNQEAVWRWYVDPLDGTTNYAHKHPFFCVSIALCGPYLKDEALKASPCLGVINAPVLKQLFWGAKGLGAFLADQPLKVSVESNLRKSLLATGFPYNFAQRSEDIIKVFETLAVKAQGIRRGGAAALDLAYVAWGVMDAFWESGLKPWDTAAGLALLSEAHGLAKDYRGFDYIIGESEDIIAGNSKIVAEILALIREIKS